MSSTKVRSSRLFRPLEVFLLIVLAVGVTAWLMSSHRLFAEDAVAQSNSAGKPDALPQQNADRLIARPPATAHSTAPPPPKPSEFATKLQENGAGTCAAAVDGLAAGLMQGVTQFNTVSNWATTAGDKRIVNVAIGQKYSNGSAVPFGFSSIMAAPNDRGSCDGEAVQVTPSPLSCTRLRATLAASGKQASDLAGVTLMQDGGGQFMLVPTAADTCVLVGVRVAYAR